MWLQWIPWKLMVSRTARARGLVDPVKILARLESFGQPIEFKQPLELLRAGMVLHARGLLNSSAIQHNLDWIWPYWVQRQYDPRNDAFIPRAFSITHINLTHRNWTAVGIPDFDELPIVDPRGLLMPFWDSWSLDSWIIAEDGRELIPSRLQQAQQHLDLNDGVAVVTHCARDGLELVSRTEVEDQDGLPRCRLALTAKSDQAAWLVVALRPYNPEGVSFVHDIGLAPDNLGWRIDDRWMVAFDTSAEQLRFSNYRTGDVYHRLRRPTTRGSIHCIVGMATAAALFRVDGHRHVRVTVPLVKRGGNTKSRPARSSWHKALSGCSQLHVPDHRIQFLYEAALRSLVLHAPGEVYPGPYTYKRFWYRDAAFILHALLCAGLADRVERALDLFPARQTRAGFFHSQNGEWDSNGEALWIYKRFCELTGRSPKPAWHHAVQLGGHWIKKKRLADTLDEPHAGLLPAGFSAEHLGPNDYYYWDDFWGVAGLESAAQLLARLGEQKTAADFRRQAGRLREAIERSLARAASRLARPGMPASPYRRLDSGSIGSLVAGYPLQLFAPADARLLDTVDYLLNQCFVRGGFFLDMVHSGINPYLTLHVAQVLLRAGDLRCLDLIRTVADLASPTGQWPEAIHPRTGGGCMGDGHHVWASAEWVVMVRNSFVREEGDRLILASAVQPGWLQQRDECSFGPTATPFGEIMVRLAPDRERVEVSWEASWRMPPPFIEVRLPGSAPVLAAPRQTSVAVERVAVA
ncbi:MAG: hypothetical protein ACE5H7_04800 [Acidiferrobacterales bacterium]